MKKVDLQPRHAETVKEILNELKLTTYAFGSRAKGTAKPRSDLDLCLKEPIEKSKIRKQMDAFEESDLPFKVDIVIWSEISESFQKHIEKDLVKFE
jgi:predicted nucleotidyltransferase